MVPQQARTTEAEWLTELKLSDAAAAPVREVAVESNVKPEQPLYVPVCMERHRYALQYLQSNSKGQVSTRTAMEAAFAGVQITRPSSATDWGDFNPWSESDSEVDDDTKNEDADAAVQASSTQVPQSDASLEVHVERQSQWWHTDLHMACIQISGLGSLSLLHALTSLNLSQTNITDDDLHSFIPCLRSLSWLHLKHCPLITSHGIAALAVSPLIELG